MTKISEKEVWLQSLGMPISRLLAKSKQALIYFPTNLEQTNHCLREINETSQYLAQLLEICDKKSNYQQFLITHAIQEIIMLHSCNFHHFVYSYHNSLAKTATLLGNRLCFQEILLNLLQAAEQAYPTKAINRIILVTSSINCHGLTITCSYASEYLNWWQRHFSFSHSLTLRDHPPAHHYFWCQYLLKKHFHGSLKILSHKHHGCTLTCYFPLSSIDSK